MKKPTNISVRVTKHLSVIALFFLLYTQVIAQQVILNENFEDGDFTQNPEWVGDVDDWIIVEQDGNNLLRLNGDSEDGGMSHLSTESIAAYGSWQFFVRLDGFVSSNNNQAFVFLVSDRADTESGVNGYGVRIGESGANKFFRIVRFDDGSQTVLVSGTTPIVQDVGYQVMVTRSSVGEWELFVSEGYGSTPQPEGDTAIDNTHTTSEYFGVRTTYTPTRFDRFFFDDFIITKNPPFTLSVDVIAQNQLEVLFSEEIEESSVNITGFSVSDGIGEPETATVTSPETVLLTFQDEIPGGEYELSVSGVTDMLGIEMEPQTLGFTISTLGNFSLLSPLDGAELTTNENDTSITEFTWDDSEDAESYTWLFISAGGSFDDPLASFDSDNDGQNTVFTISKSDLDVIAADAGVNVDESFQAEWSVRAEGNDQQRLAESPFSITLTRTESDPGDTPATGDVVINEFVHSSPSNFGQYIELFNRTSGKIFNLAEWQISVNNDSADLPEDTFLEPGEFIVIAADTTSLFDTFGSRPYLQVSTLPVLPDDGAALISVSDPDGQIIDEFEYNPETWGGFETALERRSAFAVSYAAENWADTEDPLGGTPGEENSVDIIEEPLVLQVVQFRSTTSLDLIFDRHVDRGTADDSGNFSLSGGLQVQSSQKTGFNSIRLTLASAFSFDTEYTLTVAGLESIFGIAMSQNLTFEFEEPDEILVIAEDFEDGDITQNPEWVGDLEDWTFVEEDGNTLLELDSDAADTSFLSTASPANYGTWEFYVNMQYLTSNNNRAYVYLISDRPEITSGVNGYAVRIGETGANKFFRVVRLDDGEETVLVTGATLIEANVGYQVKVTRNRDAEWELFVSPGYGSIPEPEGTPAIDNTYANASWFGLKATYTGTRLDLVQFDDIFVSKSPLFLAGINVINPQTFDVVFSEAVDPASVSLNSFIINNNVGNPQDFSIPEVNTVRIIYDENLPGGQYELTVEGIRDLSGGLMDTETLPFTIINVVKIGDVVINEFFYDNPADFAQYVELFNNTEDKLFNLNDWRIQDNTTTTRRLTTEDYFIGPGEFVVLTSDSLGLVSQFGSQNYLQLGNFPSLNRASADQIKIYQEDDILVDSLRYNPSTWGGDGVALERRLPDAPSFFAENWSESTADAGGTPGQQNTAEPDDNPLEIEAVTPVNSTIVSILFDRSVETESAGNPDNYSLTELAIETIEVTENNLVQLSLTSPMVDNNEYTLTVQDVESIFGVPLPETEIPFIFLDFVEPDFNDIVINEFLYRQVTGETPRFIELHNRSDRNLNLHEWQIGRSTMTIQLSSASENIPLRPGEYLVISDAPELLGVPDSQSFTVPTMLALSQNGDAIFVRNQNGTLVDSLRYSPSWGGSPAGFSLERLDPESASNDPANWRTHPEGHSASETNVNFEPNTNPPFPVFSKRTDDNLIEVRFNEFVSPDEDTRFLLGNTELEIFDINPFTANRVLLQEPNSNQQDTGDGDEVITIQNLPDVPGNAADERTIPVAQALSPGDLVINEIMYQPISGRYNDFPDQSEYIEFYNRRNYAINLEGIFIHDEPDRDGEISTIFPVSTTSAWIPANGYAVIFADPQSNFADTRISQFFQIEDDRFFFRADRSTLSLSTQGDAVYIATGDSTVIDSVFYAPDWHNPNLLDTRGIALERINPNSPSNEKSNWGSSVVELGGTPGNRNSLFATPETLPDTESITLEPNPFSPNGDGQDDNLFINYRLNEPDYLLSVRIFDRYGRLVRTLADGISAGFEGSLIWDGLRDNGMENRIGIYVIYFEAYNSASGKNRSFKKTVVLARPL